MSDALYRIDRYGDNHRYRVTLETEEGAVLLRSEYREVKPMCLNEIRWMRVCGGKDAFYFLEEADDGQKAFRLVANDGHVLGLGGRYQTEEARQDAIRAIKDVCADARVVDMVPEDTINTEHYHRILHEYALEKEAEKEQRERAGALG